MQKHGDNLEEKSLTVCSGTDLVAINYLHLVYPDAETAKVLQPFTFTLNANILYHTCIYSILTISSFLCSSHYPSHPSSSLLSYPIDSLLTVLLIVFIDRNLSLPIFPLLLLLLVAVI